MFADDHLTLCLTKLVGDEKWEPCREGFCFLFVRSGAGKYEIKSANRRVSQGDVLVLNAEGGGKIGTAARGELVFSSFSVLVEHMYPLFSANEISLLQNLVGSLRSVKFHAGGSSLAVECHRLVGNAPPQFNLDHRVHLLRIVTVLLGEEFKSLQRGRPVFIGMDERLIQVFEKLSASKLLRISTEELSAKLGCSRRHLSRLFHQHFGCSFATLRMELRMLRAISLLRDANAKVVQVAEQCGFNHLGLFNNCFKKRFGTSPGRWRTQNLKPPFTTASEAGNPLDCPLQSRGICPMANAPRTTKLSVSPMKNVARANLFSRPKGSKELIRTQCLPSTPLTETVDSTSGLRINDFT